ncbi:MAG: LysM peptidoglycan-binding domain-containing protein [Anaerolineaceae bacterium]|nr:LysM peptidoglycan-binding domain-containing protein [Anaerolineaceae bacterium]
MKLRLFTVPLMLLFAGLFLLSCSDPDPTPTPLPTVTPLPDVVEEPTATPVPEPTDEDEDQEGDGSGEVPADEGEDEGEQPSEETPGEEEPGDTAVPAPGSTVQHQVQVGEWLMQIARCYGADYAAVRRANPQIYWPNVIYPGMMVTLPNVGSVGEIKGSPCVASYVVEAGDTWAGLAARFGTTAFILQSANPGPLWVGNHLIVPAHNPQVVEAASQTAAAEPAPQTVQTAAEPSRIQFAAGETSATVPGNVPANGETTYVFTANEGQQYSVSLAPTQDDVMLTVENPEQTLPAEGVLPASGDYVIRVRGGEVDAAYSLELTVTNP